MRFAGLGLPIPFSVKNPNPRPDRPKRFSAVMTADKARRRSSPIWFRLLPAPSGFHILAMLWDCVYLPGGMKIILKGRTEEQVDAASEFQSEAREYFDDWLEDWKPITTWKV